jgi:hypothetical protein
MNYPIYVTVVIHCSRYEMGECNTSCTCTQKMQTYQVCINNEYVICFICSPNRNRTCIKSLGNFYSIH